MMKKAIFMLAMLTCILASCSDGGSEDPVNPTPKPEEVKAEITIDSGITTNGLSFSVTSGEQTVSFSANTNWTLSVASTTSGATWCKASATSGSKGTATVKFTVEENTSYDDRSVSVTIKAGSVSKTFTITQKGADALLVTTNKYEVAQEGGKIEVEVKANISYELAISETAKDWITESKSKSRALTTYKHTFEVAANEEAEKREGEITFKSGDKVETVKVYQAGGAILLLSKNEFTVSDTGETISVDIKSNVEYGVQMPDVDWITDEASNRGMSSHTLKYVIAANEGYDSRSAEIIFYDKNSDLKDTLKVVQAQKDAIVISQKTYDVKAEGETIEVKLSANVDFEVTMPEVDWIKQVESRGLTEHTLYFKVAENTSYGDRKAKIIFTDKESDLSDSLSIRQLNNYGTYKVTTSNNGIVELYKAGILQHFVESYIGKGSLKDGYNTDLSKLTIIGPINGDDIKVLNGLYRYQSYERSLELDLSDATIVKGGNSYYSYYESTGISTSEKIDCYTVDNFISKYMFTQLKATDITLPKNTEKIADLAFTENTKTLTIKTGDGVTYIGACAFSDCSKLRHVQIGNSVTYIDGLAFSNCSELMSVQIGNSVTHMDGGTFYGCSALKKIVIPNNVKEIGQEAFYGCSDLKEVVISNNVKEISYSFFYGCSALTKIEIPDNVTKIHDSAFYGCSALKEIVIPDNVKEIGNSAFYGCSELKTIKLGKGITKIWAKAFVETGITECYCYATTPPYIISNGGGIHSKMENTFYGISKATLYVPSESIAAYESSDWAQYFSIKEMD